jgi:hypothetical protein
MMQKELHGQVFPDWELNNDTQRTIVIYRQTYASVTALWGTAAGSIACIGSRAPLRKKPRMRHGPAKKSNELFEPESSAINR